MKSRLEHDSAWVDRYIRARMSAEEEAAFERELFDSPSLQLQLETALAIRQALTLEARVDAENSVLVGAVAEIQEGKVEDRHYWHSGAMVASLLIAVFSTTAYWKTSGQVNGLEAELAALSQPHSALVSVPIDIMRSSGGQVPDAIILKPEQNTLLMLDVELSPAAASESALHLSIHDQQEVELLSWAAGPIDEGRVHAIFDSTQVPAGKVWLVISNGQREVLDKRLLEFR